MNKTKIICTIGPASDTKETFTQLVKSGLSVARLNLSHGNQEYYKKIISMINEVREELSIPVAILMDTRGPEIRTRKFVDGSIELLAGKKIRISYGDCEGTAERFCVTYPTLHEDVQVGGTILIDDGLIELEVVEIDGEDVICVVKNGGIVKNRKGVNIPNMHLNLPALTAADEADLIFGIENDIDFVAASFVRTEADVQVIRDHLDKNGGQGVKIVSKIESQEGIDNIDAIIEMSDGIMVARGDLGVETPPEAIPHIQKLIVKKCNEADIPVIIATQMLDSMQKNPRPTRAEVSDVANAILDGTDAIMLSGESAAGKYPIESVRSMRRIAEVAETTMDYRNLFTKIVNRREKSVTNSVSHASCSTAMQLNAKAIICPTYSGSTAKLISMYRPNVPIIATTSNPKVQRQLMLNWGVLPLIMEQQTSSDILFYKSVEKTKSLGLVKSGDLVVITAGVPLGITGKTNLMKVQEVD
jgi:pyruvate kinase